MNTLDVCHFISQGSIKEGGAGLKERSYRLQWTLIWILHYLFRWIWVVIILVRSPYRTRYQVRVLLSDVTHEVNNYPDSVQTKKHGPALKFLTHLLCTVHSFFHFKDFIILSSEQLRLERSGRRTSSQVYFNFLDITITMASVEFIVRYVSACDVFTACECCWLLMRRRKETKEWMVGNMIGWIGLVGIGFKSSFPISTQETSVYLSWWQFYILIMKLCVQPHFVTCYFPMKWKC